VNGGTALDWVRDLLGATWDELYNTAARRRHQLAQRRGRGQAGGRGSAGGRGRVTPVAWPTHS